MAAHGGHIETVRLLIAHGADITADNNLAFRWASSNGYTEMVKFLIANGATLN